MTSSSFDTSLRRNAADPIIAPTRCPGMAYDLLNECSDKSVPFQSDLWNSWCAGICDGARKSLYVSSRIRAMRFALHSSKN